MIIRFINRNLSDGSMVTDILLIQGSDQIALAAISPTDAIALVGKLVNAIESHTVEEVKAR